MRWDSDFYIIDFGCWCIFFYILCSRHLSCCISFCFSTFLALPRHTIKYNICTWQNKIGKTLKTLSPNEYNFYWLPLCVFDLRLVANLGYLVKHVTIETWCRRTLWRTNLPSYFKSDITVTELFPTFIISHKKNSTFCLYHKINFTFLLHHHHKMTFETHSP